MPFSESDSELLVSCLVCCISPLTCDKWIYFNERISYITLFTLKFLIIIFCNYFCVLIQVSILFLSSVLQLLIYFPPCFHLILVHSYIITTPLLSSSHSAPTTLCFQSFSHFASFPWLLVPVFIAHFLTSNSLICQFSCLVSSKGMLRNKVWD